MPEISMKNMLEAGVHFGHQTHRWNPKMRPFIFAPRNGIYIIDLEKTAKHAQDACTFVKNTVAEGGKILFVATKKQATVVCKEAAERAGMPYVTERWLGGTLTNYSTIRQGVERMEQLERWRDDGTYKILPKKEVVVLERKRKKLEASLGGIRSMRGIPAALFVIDPEMERIAVAEANRLGVPVVAVVDTNCNPDPIDFVIPGNDDALKSVTLFVNLIADACLEGGQLYETRMRAQSGPAVNPAGTGQAEAKTEGPVVERVNKKLKNIPSDIDFRDIDNPEDEPVVAAPAAEEAATEEAAAPVAEAPAADKKPADKAPKKKK